MKGSLLALERLFAALAALLAFWILITSIDIAREGWVPIPIVDMWDRWSTYFRDHYTWTWFWEQHIDHRLVAPKLLFAVDHLLFAGRGWFLLVCTFWIQALTGLILLRLSAHAFPQDRRERVILASVMAACLFSGQQWLNFIMPFQVQFPMVYCAAAAAFFALWKAAQPDSQGRSWHPLWIALTIIAAALSTYSMANGLLLWPVVLLAAFWLRAPRRPMTALIAAAILLGPVYLYHFHLAPVPLPMSAAEKASRAALFLLAELGSPMITLMSLGKTENARIAITVIPGALLLFALIAGFVMLWRRRAQQPDISARAMLMFYCIFLAATAVLIAYGRSEDRAFNAYLSKYLTPIYILWATMLLVLWVRISNNWLRAALFGMLCVAILQVIAKHQSPIIAAVRQQTQGVHLAEIALVDNVTDPDAWYWLFHPPEITLDTADLLRKNHLTLFAESWTHWPGIALDSRFSLDRTPDVCKGKIESLKKVPSPIKPGWRITGSAWDTKANRPPRYIIFADDSGLIAGVAGFPSPPNWTGYVAGTPRPITAYLLEADDRSLCAIGTVNVL